MDILERTRRRVEPVRKWRDAHSRWALFGLFVVATLAGVGLSFAGAGSAVLAKPLPDLHTALPRVGAGIDVAPEQDAGHALDSICSASNPKALVTLTGHSLDTDILGLASGTITLQAGAEGAAPGSVAIAVQGEGGHVARLLATHVAMTPGASVTVRLVSLDGALAKPYHLRDFRVCS